MLDHGGFRYSTVLFGDIQPCILRATKHGKQNKHVDMRSHIRPEAALSREIRFQYCPTIENIANMLTEALEWTEGFTT